MEIKVVDLTAKWCAPCIALDKIMESEIIPRYKDKVEFVKIDIDEGEGEKLAAQYDILSVPSLIIFKNDKEIWRKSSWISRDEIIRELDRTLQ